MINFNYKPYYDKSTTQADKIVLDNVEYPIQAVHYIDDTYLDGNIFGTAIARQLEFELDTSVDIEGKEFVYYTGIKVNNNIEWICLGNFICYEVEPNDTTTINNVHCMDYMLKTNIPYESTLNYSGENITLLQVIQEVCTNCGITLATTSFANNSFIVDSNQFNEGELCRQVIQAVAQISGCVAKIKSDNRLYLINPNNVNTVSKVFNLNNYSEIDIKRNTQPINSVILQLKDVEGENVTMRDEASIAIYGENQLVINNNPFAYSQEKRELLITALFNAVKGFEYKAYEMDCQGLPYLETMDKVQIKDKEGNTFNSYLFRFEMTSPDGLKSTMQAPSIIKSEVDYENIAGAYDIARLTEVKVDKAMQVITALVQEVSQYDNRISQLEIDVDSIETLVRDEIDITREVNGIDTLLLYNAMAGHILELHIYGNNSVFNYLYPSDDLFPSDDLYPMGDSRIRVYTNNKCPDKIENWVNGFINSSTGEVVNTEPDNSSIILSEFISINDDFFISLENDNYKIWAISYYNSNQVFIRRDLIKLTESAITIPTNTNYIRVEISNYDYHRNDQDFEDNFPTIIPAEILDIKPMITIGDTEKADYSGYLDEVIDLGVVGVLRRLVKQDGTVITDSYDLVNGTASVTRRIGVDSGGNLYDLGTPVVTDLGKIEIPTADGDNYFNIVNYNSDCKIKWVIRNNFTNNFASTVELESSITQLASSINLQVSKKVNNNEVIARINMAILGRDEVEVPEDIEKSIIEILANKISITSDYFSITNNGIATFTQGYIGNWHLSDGYLSSNHYEGSTLFQSGLYSRSTSSGTNAFLYAGCDITNGTSGVYLSDSNFYVRNDGLCKAKWFEVNGESGYLYVNYNSGRRAMALNKSGLDQYLDNSRNNLWASYSIYTTSGGTAEGQAVFISDAQHFSIVDNVHGYFLAKFKRIGNTAGDNARIDFYATSYVNGAEIQTGSSDERLKENIEESTTNALEIIDDIDFYSFDWKETKKHVDIGFIAQRLQEKYDKLVIHNEGTDNRGNATDTYQVDLLNTLSLAMKGVQELNNKLNQQQEEIELLKEELNKLKGANNGQD